ncbi:hypothetical protein [Pedobacter mucosus]|uniref:hypothetical protein n=1 Tax=Pedobacter mucosus TaxID=2895286 RepID=UPI001EE455A0|nr:hypothetical protein [Pedobacter mucosus]UKT63375.1 hypothetical protein LOK61_16590 [Pedobacter mucosus]
MDIKPFSKPLVSIIPKHVTMEHSVEMNTLSQILEKLRLKGKDNELKITDHGKMQSQAGKIYKPEDLTIVKTYRFEGDSDPADNSVLYLVEDKEKTIGFILDAYGIYSDNAGPSFDDFLKKIPTENRDEQELFS